MKNLILHFAGGCLCLVASATYAQQSKNNAALPKFKNAQVVAEAAPGRSTPVYVNDINTRAVRDFDRTYKDAADTRWFVLKDGYTARCILNGIPAHMVYDRRGYWIYTVQLCKEGNLPVDVRSLIKGTYYDYSITQVEKINYLRQDTIYWVHLQDARTIKILRVSEGAMGVVEDYDKSK